jgi:hypothetical protein
MWAILLAMWLLPGDAWEEWVFPVVDAVELSVRPKAQQYRIGSIVILGNKTTSESVILDSLSLYSGNRLYSWRMKLAEFRLARLGLYEVDLIRRVRPRVKALDPEWVSEYKDIEVTLVEKKGRQRSNPYTYTRCFCPVSGDKSAGKPGHLSGKLDHTTGCMY